MFRKIWKSNGFWEGIGYFTLALCIFGQVTIGYLYLVAQFGYLTANGLSVARDFALDLPKANKVRDIVFTAITIALITVRIFF